MGNTVHHIELCEAILSLIDRKRAETGDATLGMGFERLAIDGQFCEVERDILENPGAIEPWLVRRRRDRWRSRVVSADTRACASSRPHRSGSLIVPTGTSGPALRLTEQEGRL